VLSAAIIGEFTIKIVETHISFVFIRIPTSPCGGGIEYLHGDPASRRRRRKGKSQI
jgi:hypothetical protein